MKCPCKRNCPRRSVTCRVECPEYADYAAYKMAEYERNAKRSAEKDVSPAQELETTPERLRELAEADKDGRVVVLPCKVGDIVWLTRTWVSERLSQPEAATLTGAYICGHGVCTFVTDKYGFQQSEIRKTVFLTREEAERAMEGQKND